MPKYLHPIATTSHALELQSLSETNIASEIAEARARRTTKNEAKHDQSHGAASSMFESIVVEEDTFKAEMEQMNTQALNITDMQDHFIEIMNRE